MSEFAETLHTVQLLPPAADAAGRNGAAISLKNFNHPVIIEFSIDQGNAATIACSLEQCTAVAGTGAKTLTQDVAIYANQDLASGDLLTRQADGKTFTTSAAVKRKLVRFVVDPASLDTANGFDCIRPVTGASNAANITAAHAILQGKYSPVLSARVD